MKHAPDVATIDSDEPNAVHVHDPAAKLRLVNAVLFALAVFAPEGMAIVGVNPRAVVVFVGLLGIYIESSGYRDSTAKKIVLFLSVFVPYAVVLSVLCTKFSLASPYSYDLERVAIILPAYMLLGALLYARSKFAVYAKMYAIAASAASVFGILEFSVGQSLFGREEALLRYGRGGTLNVRAIVLSEQPLVLGTLIMAALPIVFLQRWRGRYGFAALLTCGAYVTGSRGPLLVGLAITLASITIRLLRSEGARRRLSLTPIFVASIAGLAAVSAISVPSAAGYTSEAYSASYRLALYSILPDILANRPFGYGLGGLPDNVYLIDSQLFGVRDLAATVDSEVILSAATFGVLGLVIYIFAGAVLARAFGRAEAASTCGLVLWGSGFFVALHAWDSLGPAWFITTGCALGTLRSRKPIPTERGTVERSG